MLCAPLIHDLRAILMGVALMIMVVSTKHARIRRLKIVTYKVLHDLEAKWYLGSDTF